MLLVCFCKHASINNPLGVSLLGRALQLPLDNLPKLAEDLVLPLRPLLLGEHGQGALLVGAVDLVLLAETHGLHATVTAAAHDVAHFLKRLDLLGGEADLTAARDALALGNVGRHGRAFAGQKGVAVILN